MIPAVRHRSARAVTFAALVAAGALLTAACASSTPASEASTSSTSSTSTTTTTTTTTLPNPNALDSTAPLGAFAGLGSISRLPVGPLAPGATVEPAGTMIRSVTATLPQVGFRQFGSGPDLLLIEGAHATMTSWGPQLLSDLAGAYRVTIFDLPGVGYSSPVADLSLAGLADLIAGFIVELGLSRPSLVGWGLGADIALALDERHANLVGASVLLEPSGGEERAVLPSPADAAQLFSPIATVVQLAGLYFPPSASAARLDYLAQSLELAPDVMVARAITDEATLQRAIWARSPVANGLSGLRKRVLIVVGADDVVAPAANGERLAQAIPGAHLLRLSGAGYASAEQDETRVLAALGTFLRA